MQMPEPEISVKTATKLGLTPKEFEKIQEVLGRMPNFTELSVFSVMWSEHCSYKNSIKWLKTLPREGKRLLVKAGEENAGLVDIGDNIACAFKIEAHNQPASTEPHLGAAAGVGSVHRGIFTMGARPIAALNSLRFGHPDEKHTNDLVKGVIKVIGDFGKSLGVPTVGGEVYFNDCYNQNILVNTLSVGIARAGETVSAVAEGPGNPVFLVGPRAGKDEIHGASFDSADLQEERRNSLSAIHAGDPFQEKLMLEATLEAIKTGAIVGMQDLGTGGVACSSAKMCGRSGAGMRIELDRVPARQENMLPWEILLSESQERLLVVAHAGQEQQLLDVFEKWDLECVQIGEVTETGKLECFFKEEKVAEIAAESLVLGGGAPVYDREFKKPAYLSKISKLNLHHIHTPKDLVETAKKLFSSPNLVSRRWIYEQFDSVVRANDPGADAPSDAALLRTKGSSKSLAVTVDCNSTYVHADPYVGGMIAVAEASRNIICSGAVPVAATNCLNFGNPHDPEVFYQFVYAIKGIGDACKKFHTPVTGNNVSFYNQSKNGEKAEPVYPTPMIGMLGVLDDIEHQTSMNFKEEGDIIYMLGNCYNDLGSSEYLRVIHGITVSPAPYFDLHEEFELQKLIKKLIRKNFLRSAHGVSEGGLFTALLESALVNGFGFNVETVDTFRKDCFLFGESQSRVVVTIAADKDDEFQNYLINNNVSFTKLGEVFGSDVVIDEENFGNINDWKRNYEDTLGGKLNSR